MRIWIVLLVSISIILSGCVGGDEDPVGEGGGGENENGSSSGLASSLDADVLIGVAPLDVVFTLDVSGVDGGEVAWQLELGDDVQEGTNTLDEFPLEVGHSYTTDGLRAEHNVTFLAEAGDRQAEASVLIEVLRPPNEAQDGEVTTCLWNQVLPFWGTVLGVLMPSDQSEIVEVEGGTFYRVVLQGGGDETMISTAFISEGGERELVWGPTGFAPADAVMGSVCVSQNEPGEELPSPLLPEQGVAFSYQDGFGADPTRLEADAEP